MYVLSIYMYKGIENMQISMCVYTCMLRPTFIDFKVPEIHIKTQLETCFLRPRLL
jgi:hypothetical protein